MRRSGELHVVKECSEYEGLAGDFCTITSSNLDEISVGSKVVYAEAAGESSLYTDILLDAGSGNTAAGHVVLDVASDKGVLGFSGGTGTLTRVQGPRRCLVGCGRPFALGRDVQLRLSACAEL
jgi:hypothetical protein